MKLLGCFKIVPDLEQLTEKEWKADEAGVDTRFVRKVCSCYDESLLELMLRARDKSMLVEALEALTVEREIQTGFLKNLYALRFDRVITVKNLSSNLFVPIHTARLISNYCTTHPVDCLIFGAQSSDEGNSKVPYITAELMGWPCVSGVMDFTPEQEGNMAVEHIQFGKVMHRRMKLPCVLTVGNVPNTYLRIPTLKDRLAAAGRKAEEWSADSFHVDRKEPCLVKLKRNSQGRAPVHLDAENSDVLARRLYAEHMCGRMRKG